MVDHVLTDLFPKLGLGEKGRIVDAIYELELTLFLRRHHIWEITMCIWGQFTLLSDAEK